MGLGDLASSITDKAASALGASGGGSGPKPDKASPLDFTRKDPLDEVKTKTPLAVGPNGGGTPPNTAKTPDLIEFVHFGNVHQDTTNHFPHPKFDNEKGKKPAGRAILYRDALEREAILLYQFIHWANMAHKELKQSRGAAGAIANAAASLIGGGGGGSEPDPASLQSLMTDVQNAGSKPTDATIDYIKVHKYGIDLHQTRSDYQQYCTKKLEAFYLKPSNTSATLMAMPSVAKAAGKVFDVLFSAFDIYFAIFLHLRSTYEKKIEQACYDFSIDTVKNYTNPTFAIWFAEKKQDAQPAASTLPGPLASVENDYNKGKKDVTDLIGEEDQKDPPGTAVLGKIFGLFGAAPSDDGDDDKDKDKDKDKGKDKKDPDPATNQEKAKTKDKIDPADVVVNAAFKDVIGSDLPKFLQVFIGKVTWINVEFLQMVYLQLCKDSDKSIDTNWLDKTAHESILKKLVSLLEDALSFLKKGQNFSVDMMGQKLGPKKLIDKGEDAALADKIGPYADKVLNILVSQLGSSLSDLYNDANPKKSITMELYLGALPALLAMQVRNTMFPILYMLFNDLFFKGNSALDVALKPVKDLISKAQDVAYTAKDKVDRANQAYDKFNQEGANVGSGGQNVMAYKNILTGNTPKPTTPGASTASDGGFPGTTRKTDGTGNKIPADDVKKAENDRVKTWPP